MLIHRALSVTLHKLIAHGRSMLLLGPRQVGKTTLLADIPADKRISFIAPRTRLLYEKDPSRLADEIRAMPNVNHQKPLIVIDEVQKVPMIMDVVQELIDEQSAQFILTGSSARKLKRGHHSNLLPGRVIPLYLDPLSYEEMAFMKPNLSDLLSDGLLPQITLCNDDSERAMLLDAYVSLYLEEEIRSEALVRQLASFARFLELAAAESGQIVNFSKLSQQLGIAHTTVANYYQILEDCLIAHRIAPYRDSRTRAKLTTASRYVFFDLGVRRIAALEDREVPAEACGRRFEQYIILECIKQTRLFPERIQVLFWRDPDGPEIDILLKTSNALIPIEVKWTDRPTEKDTRHLKTFLKEYPEAQSAYIVCQTPTPLQLDVNIQAIPWQSLSTVFKNLKW